MRDPERGRPGARPGAQGSRHYGDNTIQNAGRCGVACDPSIRGRRTPGAPRPVVLRIQLPSFLGLTHPLLGRMLRRITASRRSPAGYCNTL